MFHLGVIKALSEANVLPRVISGSSAGAIIASMVGTRTDEELPAMFDPESLSLQAFQTVSLRQVLAGSALMDPRQLLNCLERNIIAGQLHPGVRAHTAHPRRHRIAGRGPPVGPPAELPDGAERYRAVGSVLASCAVPGVFPPVMLDALDFDGVKHPYMRSKRWVDGSIANDLPMLRLARLHNVNHYIVSQTNPHVVPFMREQNPRRRSVDRCRPARRHHRDSRCPEADPQLRRRGRAGPHRRHAQRRAAAALQR